MHGAGPVPAPLQQLHEAADTALIVRDRFFSPGAGPQGATIEETFSDYRDVQGLKVAFKATVSRDGTPLVERVLRSFDINPTLAATLFTKPS